MLSKFMALGSSATTMQAARQTQFRMVRQLTKTQQRTFGAFPNHRDTADNLEESPFEFNDESYAAIEKLLDKYPDNYKSSAVIPVLFIAQKQNNNGINGSFGKMSLNEGSRIQQN